MPSFTNTELNTFLTENANIMRLSTMEPDGHPYVTPVWFDYTEDTFNILGRKQNKWVENIRGEAKVGACVDTSNALMPGLLLRPRPK